MLHVVDDKMEDVTKYYLTGAHAAISRNLLQIDANTDGRDLYDLVDSFSTSVPPDKKPVWMVSDVASRLNTTVTVVINYGS